MCGRSILRDVEINRLLTEIILNERWEKSDEQRDDCDHYYMFRFLVNSVKAQDLVQALDCFLTRTWQENNLKKKNKQSAKTVQSSLNHLP